MTAREVLREAKRVVVKVGTSTLTHPTGRLNLARIEELARTMTDLAGAGREMVLVSSGAIGAGMGRVGLKERPSDIPSRQALAAIGQGVLMQIYEKIFAEYGQLIAQVLLTRENARYHSQYINSRGAILALIGMGAIPIINENDVVAIDEVKIGDNDNLSAIVATLIDADALIILSDIDGLYTANPQKDKSAALISEVGAITPEIEMLAGGAGSAGGIGGMITKIQAAKIAASAGVTMAIAKGRGEVLRRVLAGETVGTVFPARESHLQLRKSWLAFGKRLAGDIEVDAGCELAMREGGASLLPAGIAGVDGDFSAGSTVRVLAANGQEIARGIANYNSEDLLKLKGRQTAEIPGVLGRPGPSEAIHRDNMVLMI